VFPRLNCVNRLEKSNSNDDEKQYYYPPAFWTENAPWYAFFPAFRITLTLWFGSVGFGLWKVENDAAADVVQMAVKAGVRLFDGALP
jgi:hypothetical protein